MPVSRNFSNLKIDWAQPEIQFALKTVREGAAFARQIRSQPSLEALSKKDQSPVTLADFGIQAIAGALLEEAHSCIPLVAEENASLLKNEEEQIQLKTLTDHLRPFIPAATPEAVCQWIDRGAGAPAETFWVLDPIDGTKGFLRGDQYVTALALVQESEVRMAAISCPNLSLPTYFPKDRKGILVFALRGSGCWATLLDGEEQWKEMRVSDHMETRQACFLESMELGHRNAERVKKIKELLSVQVPSVFLDSQAKHVVLAAGEGDVFLRMLSPGNPNFREKIWDVAPGALVIEEAGGCVTDLEGYSLDFGAGPTLAHNQGFIATNGALHFQVLNAVQKTAAPT